MFLSDDELQQLNKLGFTINSQGKLTELKKESYVDDLLYCGIGTYLDKEGYVYYKNGGKIAKVNDPEIEAEVRFVKRHLNKKKEAR